MSRYLVLMLASLFAAAASPEDGQLFNVVTLSASAHREVPNDQASAVLYVESTDGDPAALADRINAAVAAGLKVAKAYPAVKSHVGTNNTYPVYGNSNKQTGWRGHADIRLESTDVKALAELVAKLQTSMQLGGINFSLSSASKDQIDTALIDEAIEAFRARAEVVRKSFGGKGYRIVAMNVNTQDGGMPRPVMFRAAAAADKLSSVSAPPLDAGESEINVEVTGSVQIQ
jgi:predicted secreted protein